MSRLADITLQLRKMTAMARRQSHCRPRSLATSINPPSKGRSSAICTTTMKYHYRIKILFISMYFDFGQTNPNNFELSDNYAVLYADTNIVDGITTRSRVASQQIDSRSATAAARLAQARRRKAARRHRPNVGPLRPRLCRPHRELIVATVPR